MRMANTIVTGYERAADMVKLILAQSQFVQVTPCPDDEYQVSVKEENSKLLEMAVAATFDPEVE